MLRDHLDFWSWVAQILEIYYSMLEMCARAQILFYLSCCSRSVTLCPGLWQVVCRKKSVSYLFRPCYVEIPLLPSCLNWFLSKKSGTTQHQSQIQSQIRRQKVISANGTLVCLGLWTGGIVVINSKWAKMNALLTHCFLCASWAFYLH